VVGEDGVRCHATGDEKKIDGDTRDRVSRTHGEEHPALDSADPAGTQVEAQVGIDGSAKSGPSIAERCGELGSREDGMGREEVQRLHLIVSSETARILPVMEANIKYDSRPKPDEGLMRTLLSRHDAGRVRHH
jgi:hypothetical protein